MRLLVCGSRTFGVPQLDGIVRNSDRWLREIERAERQVDLLKTVLRGYVEFNSSFADKRLVIIEGKAPGADTHAGNYARGWMTQRRPRMDLEEYPADWKKYRKAAGPIRNQQMLDEGKPTDWLAFVDKPLSESTGTADMVSRLRKARLPGAVIEAFN